MRRVFARLPSRNYVMVGDVVAVVEMDGDTYVQMSSGMFVRAADGDSRRAVLNRLFRAASVAAVDDSSDLGSE